MYVSIQIGGRLCSDAVIANRWEMYMKKISIIIPCYNVEQYLDRCFQSLVSQTLGFENMELIFINDASADGTLARLLEYEKQYPDNIVVINFEENQSQGTARNVALDYASAPYIGYVDSDDWVDSAMYEKLLATIEEHDCDFVECKWDFVDKEGKKQYPSWFFEPGYVDLTDGTVKADFVCGHVAMAMLWNKVFKKSFLVENDIFCLERIRYEDFFFCHLAFIYAKSYCFIGDELYHYFKNDNGIVQRKHKEYQFDKMDVAFEFLQTCINRNLMQQDKDNIEWLFLEKYYIYMLIEVFEEFPDRAYSIFLKMQKTIRKYVPDYKIHPYRTWEINQMDDTMLHLLDYDLSEGQFASLKERLMKKIQELEGVGL